MPNDVINTRRVTMNDPNPINTQSRRPPGRRLTPPAQPRPVFRNRNLQVPRVPNILSNLSPFRRTKSTRKTRGIKGYEVTQSQGKKRKTKVNVAKKSKRASQKKRGRKMSRRQRGGRAWEGKDCKCGNKKAEGVQQGNTLNGAIKGLVYTTYCGTGTYGECELGSVRDR